MPDGLHTVTTCEIERGIQHSEPYGEQRQLVPVDTGSIQVANHGRFALGVSGNAKGRPKGSHNKLSELFILAMREDFAEHGPSAIAQLRERDPGQYLAAIRSMIPANTMADNADKLPTVDDAVLSDAEFAATIDGEGNPLEHAAVQARRNRAFELFASGRHATMREAMIACGAAIP